MRHAKCHEVLAVTGFVCMLSVACADDEGDAPADAGAVAEASDGGGDAESGDAAAQDAAQDATQDAAQDAAEDAAEDAPPVCTREELRALVDDYFAALEAHDADRLPLAPDVRFTENAEDLELGEGLWQKAGEVRFRRSLFDTERCGTHTQAVLSEDDEAIIFGVRLQVEDGAITEIETLITHDGDYIVFFPDNVGEPEEGTSVTDVRWEELLDEDERSTREELNEIADLYFESFGPAGIVAPIERDCYRWENGLRTTNGDCTLFLPEPGQGRGGITHRRYPIADVEAGIAIGYVLFQGALDFHMFKIIDGEVRLIQAVVTASGYTSSGWE